MTVLIALSFSGFIETLDFQKIKPHLKLILV